MNKILAYFFILLVCTGKAQQDPNFTMYWNSLSTINPAFTGLQHKHLAVLSSRQQWVGLDGAPQVYLASYDMRLDSINSGLGLSYIYDQVGFTNSHLIKGRYSLIRKIGVGKLSVGVSPGIISSRLIGSQLNPITPGDPNIPTGNVNRTLFTLGAGVAYSARSYTVFLSGTNLLKVGNQSSLPLTLPNQYYLSLWYSYLLGASWDFRPNALLRISNSSIQGELSLLAQYTEKFWAGISYRTQDALAFSGGISLKNHVQVGYSYDITLSRLSGYSNGSHEVALLYAL